MSWTHTRRSHIIPPPAETAACRDHMLSNPVVAQHVLKLAERALLRHTTQSAHQGQAYQNRRREGSHECYPIHPLDLLLRLLLSD